MEEKDIVAALQGMLANNVDAAQALSLIQQAVAPNVSEAALIDDLKVQHPGLLEEEYRVLFNQRYPAPSEDDEDAATKETIRKAEIAKAISEKRMTVSKNALEKLQTYLPDVPLLTRRAEQVTSWSAPLRDAIKEDRIELDEGIFINAPKGAALDAMITQVADFAVQQGLEPGAEVPEQLKDQMARIALAFEGAAGFKAAIKGAVAKAREEILHEFSTGRSLGGPATPPPRKDLPKAGGGFV